MEISFKKIVYEDNKTIFKQIVTPKIFKHLHFVEIKIKAYFVFSK